MPRGSAPPELGAEGISRVAGRGVSRLTKKLIVKGAASVSGELTCLPRERPVADNFGVSPAPKFESLSHLLHCLG